MSRLLSESIEIQIVLADNNIPLQVDNMCSAWGGLPYSELSVILVHLRYLQLIHQNHHWTAKGDPFFGDHLLFQRLYDTVTSEIDAVAEKAVGLGTTDNVNVQLQVAQVTQLLQGYGTSQTIPQASELAKRSLAAEMNFLAMLKVVLCRLKESCQTTPGLDNMLAGIADVHESHVYLLKQRSSLNVEAESDQSW